MPWCDHGIMYRHLRTALLDDLKGPDSDSHCGGSKRRGWVSVDPRFRRRTKRYTTTDTRGREEKVHTDPTRKRVLERRKLLASLPSGNFCFLCPTFFYM